MQLDKKQRHQPPPSLLNLAADDSNASTQDLIDDDDHGMSSSEESDERAAESYAVLSENSGRGASLIGKTRGRSGSPGDESALLEPCHHHGESGTVQAFMTGGGRVVRKLAQRILNACVGGQEHAVSSHKTPLASPRRPSALIMPPPPQPTESPTDSAVFGGPENVKRWRHAALAEGEHPSPMDIDDEASPQQSQQPQPKLIKKRIRAADAADADYDRGKQKKVRRVRATPWPSRAHAQGAAGGAASANPFQAVQARRGQHHQRARN